MSIVRDWNCYRFKYSKVKEREKNTWKRVLTAYLWVCAVMQSKSSLSIDANKSFSQCCHNKTWAQSLHIGKGENTRLPTFSYSFSPYQFLFLPSFFFSIKFSLFGFISFYPVVTVFFSIQWCFAYPSSIVPLK